MRVQRTTGLTQVQFRELRDRLLTVMGPWQSMSGRPRGLSFEEALRAALMYFRLNVAQEVIAELWGIGQASVSRYIAAFEVSIAEVLDDAVPDLTEEVEGRVVLIDGSLCPTWSYSDAPELYSGKHHTTGYNHQFVSYLDGTLVHISDAQPGSTHDAKAFTRAGLDALVTPETAIADKGYLGRPVTVPKKKPPHGELLDWHHQFNTTINALRAAIERAIAHFKNWRIMHTDYRRPNRTYPNAFNAVRALHFFATSE